MMRLLHTPRPSGDGVVLVFLARLMRRFKVFIVRPPNFDEDAEVSDEVLDSWGAAGCVGRCVELSMETRS